MLVDWEFSVSVVHSCSGKAQCLLGYKGKNSASNLRPVILLYYWSL